MTAPVNALTAMPVRISVTTSVRPPDRDAASRRAAPRARPPTNAATGDAPGAERRDARATITATAPSAAPDETPTMPGSASGLRNVPCIDGAGARQRRADQHGQHDAREADLPEHRLGDPVGRRARRRGRGAGAPRRQISPSGIVDTRRSRRPATRRATSEQRRDPPSTIAGAAVGRRARWATGRSAGRGSTGAARRPRRGRSSARRRSRRGAAGRAW